MNILLDIILKYRADIKIMIKCSISLTVCGTSWIIAVETLNTDRNACYLRRLHQKNSTLESMSFT